MWWRFKSSDLLCSVFVTKRAEKEGEPSTRSIRVDPVAIVLKGSSADGTGLVRL